MADNYPTWRRAHCIECYGDAEHCPTCGCHEDPFSSPVVSNVSNQSLVPLDTAGSEKAPGANRGQPTTTESKESK